MKDVFRQMYAPFHFAMRVFLWPIALQDDQSTAEASDTVVQPELADTGVPAPTPAPSGPQSEGRS